ncbi:MAG: GNAT family N-acetyltransferase [Desulfosarcina sp.]|nr:GNAT family N-acetyltransferase [Desulfobacterales bacterium]
MSSLKIFHSIESVNRDDWDFLAHDQVLMRHGWLKTVEQTYSGRLSPRYVILYESARPVAATAYRQINSADGFTNFDYFLFGGLKPYLSRLGISSLPMIALMPSKGYPPAFLTGLPSDPAAAQKKLQTLLGAIHDHGCRGKMPVAFTKVSGDDREAIRLLRRNGYTRIIAAPLAYMDIVWSSFSDYRKDTSRISKNLRRKINWEVNRNRKEGIEIVVLENLRGYEDRLYRLLTLNAARHNMAVPTFDRNFFKVLSENMPNEARVYAAFKKGELVGMSLFMAHGAIWHALLVGIDHHLTGNDLTYFNIVFYRPIRDAIEAQCKRIYYGNSLYEPKIRRGCQLLRVYTYYKPYSRIGRMGARPFFFVHRAWNRGKRPLSVRQQLKSTRA